MFFTLSPLSPVLGVFTVLDFFILPLFTFIGEVFTFFTFQSFIFKDFNI